MFREIARVTPGWKGLSWATLLPLGPCVSRETPLPAAFSSPAPAAAASGDGLWLLSGGTLFLQGSLSHRTAQLPSLAGRPRAFLHPAEVKRLGIADGDAISLAGPGGALQVACEADDTVPAGSVFVPYAFPDLDLNRLGAPSGAGLRVRVTRAEVGERVGA